MKVAIVAPPFGENGGPEVVSKNLAEALSSEGVDVTLFAPEDWHTSVPHIPTLKKSIWNMKKDEKKDIEKLRIDSQMKVVEFANEFDIIHFNCQSHSQYAAKKINKPCVITLHNNYSKEKTEGLRRLNLHPVAISNTQNKRSSADAVVHNGIPLSDIEPSFEKGDYLLFIGRLTDQKGVDTAIKIALESGEKLVILGRIGNTRERKLYFENKLQPFIDGKQICYVGNVDHDDVYEYCRKAKALLFPIRRPESFGLVAIEALACGTPVIGTKIDPLPEILNDGQVAFLSDDIKELVSFVKHIEKVDRKKCRKFVEEKFSGKAMAQNYLKFYQKILGF